MKALSIQQPWAYCITNGTKRVENRTWYARHRGLLLIHAGKQYQLGTEREIHADSPEVPEEGMLLAPRGAVVGYCCLVDCIRPGENSKLPEDQLVWSDPDQFKFLLADVHVLEVPVPWRGALGFFDIAADVVDGSLQILAPCVPPVISDRVCRCRPGHYGLAEDNCPKHYSPAPKSACGRPGCVLTAGHKRRDGTACRMESPQLTLLGARP